MGVRKTTDFLEKATWVLAGSLLILSIAGSAFIPRQQLDESQSRVQDQIENAIDPTQVPNFPTTVPEAEPGQNAAPAENENGGGQQ